MRLQSTNTGWAIRHHDENELTPRRLYLEGVYDGKTDRHACLRGYTRKVFATRKDAREFVKAVYGYIKDRPDLTGAPHYWRTPKVVRVRVTVTEI